MTDVIQLTTDEIVEIRKHCRPVDHKNPVIALPDFEYHYTETRPDGASYIIHYTWDEEDQWVGIELRFGYTSKPEFTIFVRFEEDPDDAEKYKMVCGFDSDKPVDDYWTEQLAVVHGIDNESDFATWQALAYEFFIINSYIAYHDMDETFELEEKVVKQPSKKSSKKKSNNKVRLYRCYKLKREWQKSKALKRPHKIECSAWGVRGHFRHYKNGKIVFIKAYVKGKNKENYKGKEYKLIGDTKC